MPERFQHFLAIDWSGAASERHKGIALALADAAGGPPVLVERPARGWSREQVLMLLRDELPPDTLVGMDLGISLPFADCGAYFPGLATSPPDAKALWAMIDQTCRDDAHLAVSSLVDHHDIAPYFRRQGGREGAKFRCDGAAHGRGRFRVTEHVQARMGCKPYSNFNLVGAAQVGKSSLSGMRMLHRLRDALPIWPVDPLAGSGSAIVEIYTALAAIEAGRTAARSKMTRWEHLDDGLRSIGSAVIGRTGPISDHDSDALLTAAWLRKAAGEPNRWNPLELTPEIACTEGWTFGAV